MLIDARNDTKIAIDETQFGAIEICLFKQQFHYWNCAKVWGKRGEQYSSGIKYAETFDRFIYASAAEASSNATV